MPNTWAYVCLVEIMLPFRMPVLYRFLEYGYATSSPILHPYESRDVLHPPGENTSDKVDISTKPSSH